jgi:hypothetical protein
MAPTSLGKRGPTARPTGGACSGKSPPLYVGNRTEWSVPFFEVSDGGAGNRAGDSGDGPSLVLIPSNGRRGFIRQHIFVVITGTSRSVFRGPFQGINDDDLNPPFRRFELQSKLFLDRSEKRRVL